MNPIRPHHATSRIHGIAMLLVLFAVAVATVLSVSFLSAQSTTTGISANIQHHARARFIAESAMYMITRHLQEDEDWRTNYTDGTWASNQSLAGGTFTIVGRDGIDTDDDGDIDGDGSLSDDPEDPLTIIVTGTYEGRTHIVRALLETFTEETEATGSANGVNVTGKVKLKNNARMDAFNSATGTYAPGTNSTALATIATNTTGNDQVELSNSAAIIGNVLIGVGATPANVVDLSGSASISGTKTAQTTPLTVPSIPTLSPMPSSSGSYTSPNSGSTTLNAGSYRYTSFTLKNSYIINISGNVTIYCDGKFEIDNSAEMRLNAGARLTIYADNFNFKNNGKLNMTSPPTPSNLILYGYDSDDLTIDNSFQLAASILAPTSKLLIKNNARFFGNFFGKEIELDNSARFTQDLALTSGGGVSGGASQTTYYQVSRWLE